MKPQHEPGVACSGFIAVTIPHIHYLVPGGGLSPDGRRWVPAKKFLLYHKALGAHLCTLFHHRLRHKHPALFAQVPAKAWQCRWNVGCQNAGSGENALRYWFIGGAALG